jgi:hypothetical protein
MSQQSEGRLKIATLTDGKRRLAKRVVSAEPAPRGGRKRCQDWVLDAMISLEADEIVEAGWAECVHGMVGKPATRGVGP